MSERIVLFRYTADSSQATAETQKLNKTIDETGKAGAKSANEASDAFKGYEKAASGASAVNSKVASSASSAGTSINSLLFRQQQLTAESRRLTEGINLLQRVMQRTPDTTGLLASKMEELLLAKRAVGRESEHLGRQIDKADGAFNRMTTRISVGRGLLSGFDSAVEGAARAVGGINLGLAISIGLVSSLTPALFSLIDASQIKLEIDKEQILIDLQRSNSQLRTLRTTADLITAFQIIAGEQKNYEENTKKLTAASSDLETQGQRTRVMYGRLSEGTVLITATSGTLRNEIGQFNTKLVEQEKTMAPAIGAILAYRDATGKSTDEIIRAMEKTGRFAAETIPFFRQQLDATLPFLDAFSDALTKLRVPQFSLGATSQGIAAQDLAVQAGLFTAMQKGVTDMNAAVLAVRPSVKALDESLKIAAGNFVEYKRLVAGLSLIAQEAIEVSHRQEKVYKENFETRRKGTLDLIALEKEAVLATIRATEEGLDQKEALIREEFKFRRQELERNGQLTVQALHFLRIIEHFRLTEVSNERAQMLKKDQAERHKLIEEGLETRLRLEREFFERERRLILQHGRQTRILLEAEERAFRERRLGRDTRGAMQADEIGRQARELDRVRRVFHSATRESKLFNQQLDLVNSKLSGQQALVVTLQSAWEDFKADMITSGQIFLDVADSIGAALQSAVAGTEDFSKALKASMLNLIADLAAYWGRYFILKGAGMLLTNPALGAALIAAGTALYGFAGLVRGAAQKLSQDAQRGGGGASASAGGGGGSGASSGASSGSAGGSSGSVVTGNFAGERSRFSPGAEVSGSARIAEINQRIARLQSWVDRLPGETSVFERAFRRQIELLARERATLLGASSRGAIHHARSITRLPFNTSGPYSTTIQLDRQASRTFLKELLDGEGVVTVNNAEGRHNRRLKKALKAS